MKCLHQSTRILTVVGKRAAIDRDQRCMFPVTLEQKPTAVRRVFGRRCPFFRQGAPMKELAEQFTPSKFITAPVQVRCWWGVIVSVTSSSALARGRFVNGVGIFPDTPFPLRARDLTSPFYRRYR